MFTHLVVLLATLYVSSAAVIPAAVQDNAALGPPNADCQRHTYPITATSSNVQFSNVTVPKGTEAKSFVTELTQRFATGLTDPAGLANFTAAFLSNGTKVNVTNTYNISGILCTPKNGAKDNNTVQLLIHGIGTDSSWWHFTGKGVPIDNSYVFAAANAGMTTFRYDRLGTGKSEHPEDAYNVVQAPTDVAIATKIAQSLKDGSLSGIPAFSKLVVVGYSYGSVQTNALTAVPGLVDHAVLTAFAANAAGIPLYLTSAAYTPTSAIKGFTKRLGKLSFGYLATAVKQTTQMPFLFAPNFTPAAQRLLRATEQPVTHGVLMTFASVLAPAPAYNGTVAVVTGDKDFIFCVGDCYNVAPNSTFATIPDGAKSLFPAASKFTTYLPKDTGHAISVHKTAGETYTWIQQYLASL